MGSFLKIASLIEASSKRAIGRRLGIDPSSEGVGRLEFYSALVLCRDAKLITVEAFDFANYVRQVRNDMVHKGGILHLDIEQFGGSRFFQRYRARVDAFISIRGMKIDDGAREHLRTLLVGCIAFLALLVKALFNEDWLQPNRPP